MQREGGRGEKDRIHHKIVSRSILHRLQVIQTTVACRNIIQVVIRVRETLLSNLQCAEKQLSQFLERETLGENLYIVNGKQGFQS